MSVVKSWGQVWECLCCVCHTVGIFFACMFLIDYLCLCHSFASLHKPPTRVSITCQVCLVSFIALYIKRAWAVFSKTSEGASKHKLMLAYRLHYHVCQYFCYNLCASCVSGVSVSVTSARKGMSHVRRDTVRRSVAVLW